MSTDDLTAAEIRELLRQEQGTVDLAELRERRERQRTGAETEQAEHSREMDAAERIRTGEDAYLAGTHIAHRMQTRVDSTPYSAFLCSGSTAINENAELVAQENLLSRIRETEKERRRADAVFHEFVVDWEETWDRYVPDEYSATFFKAIVEYNGDLTVQEEETGETPGHLMLSIRGNEELGTVEDFLDCEGYRDSNSLTYRGNELVSGLLLRLYDDPLVINQQFLTVAMQYRPEHPDTEYCGKLMELRSRMRELRETLP